MNVTQTTETVHRHVPTDKGHISVAAGLGSHRLVMEEFAKVRPAIVYKNLTFFSTQHTMHSQCDVQMQQYCQL